MIRRPTCRLALAVIVAAAPAACRDRVPEGAASAADSALERDLTLASGGDSSRMVELPELKDVPVAPPPAPAKATPRPAAQRPTLRPTVPAPSTPAPSPAPVAEAPAPAPAAEPDPGPRIAAGTQIPLETKDRICTSNHRPGDKFVARITQPITGTQGASLPAGAVAVIEVLTVTRASTADSSGLTFRVLTVGENGVYHQAQGTAVASVPLEKTKTAGTTTSGKRAVAGAVLGAVIGQVVSKDAKGTAIGAAAGAAAGAASGLKGPVWDSCLPAGAALTLTLSAPLDLRS